MGLVVTQNLVTVDHAVREHLITTADGNPKTEIRECGLKVRSLFTRIKDSAKRSRNRKISVIGDNCPLLYALKGKDGLKTNITSIKRLVESGSEILAAIAEQTQADTVVYMPSGYSLSRIVASRCASMFEAQLARVVMVDDLLATGRTLSVAKEIVQAMNGVTSVEAVCLFSDV